MKILEELLKRIVVIFNIQSYKMINDELQDILR